MGGHFEGQQQGDKVTQRAEQQAFSATDLLAAGRPEGRNFAGGGSDTRNSLAAVEDFNRTFNPGDHSHEQLTAMLQTNEAAIKAAQDQIQAKMLALNVASGRQDASNTLGDVTIT